MAKDVGEMNTGTKFHWKKVTVSGSLLSGIDGRHGCSATLAGNLVWVIGGKGFLRSFSLLDLKKEAWVSQFLENDTFNFHLHAACLFQDQILLLWAKRRQGSSPFSEAFHEVILFDPLLNKDNFR